MVWSMHHGRVEMSTAHASVTIPPYQPVDGAEAEAFVAATVGADARQILNVTTSAVVRLLGDRGSCILFDGVPRVAVSTYGPTYCGGVVDVSKYPEIMTAVRARSVIAIEDAHADPRLVSVHASLPMDVRSIAVVPLVIRDECVGVVVAQSSQVRDMNLEAISTASLLGRLAARLLPVSAAVREREVFSRPSAPTSDPSAMRRSVLVIDDDDDNAGLVGEILTRAGYDTVRAEDGEEGVRIACELQPDLVLLDVDMPKLDGFGAAELLGDDLLTRHIPILFLSGSPDLMPRIRTLKHDGVDFLAKPFKKQELLTRIDLSFTQADERRKIRTEANLDELTGLGNLRLLRERLAIEQARWQRHETPISLVTIDVDKLKRINDTLGHAAGSVALSAIGNVLRESIRETDLAVRYGGDEFVLVLPHTDLEEAHLFGERVLERIRALRCNGTGVSVSIGVAALDQSGTTKIERALEESDAAAYRAKRGGGNRCCAYSSELDEASVSSRAH